MLLIANHLIKEYKQGDKTVKAVDDVSLSVNKGDFISIVGRSGSGKSTLLNILAGLLTPTSGEVLFGDENIAKHSDKERSLLRNTKIGYIMQGQSVLSNLTVLQNVLLPNTLFKNRENLSVRANELLEKVGIGQLANRYPATLSGGEMRRVSIARSLLHAPDLLIADEPTGDLDEETTSEIMELFAAVAKEGTAVLMVTHDLGTTRFGERVLRMQAGSLAEQT